MNLSTRAQLAIAFLGGVLTSVATLYFLNRPSTFAECVLASGPAGSDMAAALIARACRERFPAQASREPERDITDPENLLTLSGAVKPAYGNTFKGRLYNASEQETITHADIALAAISGADTITRVYRTNVYIPPRSADDFTFDAVLGDYYTSYQWRLVGARGFRSMP